MRKKIFILLQIALVIIFLRSSFAQHFFGGIAENLVQWYEDIVEVPERRKIMALRDTFMRNNMSLQPHQVDYVFDVTDTSEDINQFYTLYCEKDDKNPYMYGANLKKFCTDIQNSELLVDKQIQNK